MATVKQVTGTGFDSNIWGLVPDNDGTTCWAFQDESGSGIGKYARFSLVDGSIVHAGNLFGGTSSYSLTPRTDASVLWAQENGKYYAIGGLGSSRTLYQFTIAPSGGGSTEVLDTYSTATASYALATALPGTVFFTNLIAWTQGGSHYVAVQSTNSAQVAVFDDTLTLIGTYILSPTVRPAGELSGQCIFADKNGDLWMSAWANTSPPSLALSYWHPASGGSGGTLNSVVDTFLPNTTTGFTTSGDSTQYIRYVPSNHSVMLSNYGTVFGGVYTSPLSNVLLGTPGSAGTFTQNHFRADDGSFFFNNIAANFSAWDASDLELTVVQPPGKLAIEGDTTGTAANTQVGGIINVIDPIALTSYGGLFPFDITQAILGAAVPAPPQNNYTDHGTAGNHYDPFANMVYSEVNNTVAVTYAQTDYSTGSALYLVSFATHLAVSPTTLAFTAEQCSNPSWQDISITTPDAWTVSSDASWLTAGAETGTGDYNNPVEVNTSGLTPGTYTGHLTVTATGAIESPIVVTVTLTVTAPPLSIVLSSADLKFGDVLGISLGGGTFAFTAVSDESWLVLSATSGTTPETITASVDSSELDPGSYEATITIASPGKTTKVITVNITVVGNVGGYITTHRQGLDAGHYITDGESEILRQGINVKAWSPIARPVGGCGALQSIETSPGTYSLMMARPWAGDTGSPPTSSYLLARDVSTWQDDSENYGLCQALIGSITLSQLGAPLVPIQHIVGYFDAVGTLGPDIPSPIAGQPTIVATQPVMEILPNEIKDTGGVGFITLPETVPEPPTGQTTPSQTILQLRWPLNMMNSALLSQLFHHMQLRITFPPENVPNTIKALALKEDQN